VSDTPEETARKKKLLEELWQLDEQIEQDRIIEIIERCPRVDDDYMILCDARHLIELIKGEQKPIHTHDIEVFGAPCDCGTRHEYCGECDWVEPCEQEGEQK
jgi:hypothetical protein